MTLPSPTRCIGESLAREARGEHETAFGNGEYRHALPITRAIGGRIALSAARAGRRARGPRARGSPRSHCHRARAGGKFKRARLEFMQRAFVFKEDDLTVNLAAGLKPGAQLRHGRITDMPAMNVHAAFTLCARDNEASLTHGWENRVAVALRKECSAIAGILEQYHRIGVVVGVGHTRGEQSDGSQDKKSSAQFHVRWLLMAVEPLLKSRSSWRLPPLEGATSAVVSMFVRSIDTSPIPLGDSLWWSR